MVKVTRLFILLLLVFVGVYAAEPSSVFKEFDSNFNKTTLSNKKRLHQNIKTLYLQSKNKKNKDVRIGALKRLIYSSKKLNYRALAYEKELKTLNVQSSSNSNNNIPKTIKKQVLIPEKKNKVSNNISTNHNLISVKKSDDVLIFKFDNPINQNDLKTFAIANKNFYRKVIDIKGLKKISVNSINDFSIKEVRVAQFKPETIRIVFSDPSKFELQTNTDENSITFKIKSSSNKNTNNSRLDTSINKLIKPSSTLKIKTITIDPGHGGKDTGAIAGGYREKDIVLGIGLKLGDILKKRGYRVHYTRSSDIFWELKARTSYANTNKSDIFISIHANAAPSKNVYEKSHGLETFFLSPTRSERSKNVYARENKGNINDMNYFSKEIFLNFLNREKIVAANKLAIDVHTNILSSVRKKFSISDSGVREGPFWVLVGAQMPAILVETGYITNPTERKHLINPNYQKGIAEGIANGIDSYFAKNR